MTPSKTPKMIAINKEIKKLNPNIKALNYYDFINTEAKKLLKEHTNEESILEQKKLLHKIAEVPFLRIEGLFPSTKSEDISNFNNTAKFFGIDESNKALIQKLSSTVYTHIIIDEMQLIDKIINTYRYQELKQSFDEWLELCKKLDLFKNYFDSLNKQKQEQLKQGLKILNHAPFIEGTNIIKEFALFLDNHRLSQLNKFKINKLLEINLPNVTTLKIAEDIYKYTNLKHI